VQEFVDFLEGTAAASEGKDDLDPWGFDDSSSASGTSASQQASR
jgi:hypothetical protein